MDEIKIIAIAESEAPEVAQLSPEIARIVAGAVFDFAAYLTLLKEPYCVGQSKNSDRMVDEIRIWARSRGLVIKGADVMGWNQITGADPTELKHQP